MMKNTKTKFLNLQNSRKILQKIFLIVLLLVFLLSVNIISVSAVECSCTWDNELLMWLPNPGYCTGGCQYAVCGGSGPTDCSCELINRDYDWYACKNCGLDSTSGDDGIGYGSYLFGYGDPSCCGDDNSEYYTELFFDSGACCNEVTDCALGDGDCLNSQSASGTKLCVDRTIYNHAEGKFVDYDPFESGEIGACGLYDSIWDTTCDCNDYWYVCESSIGCDGDWINWYETPSGVDTCCTGETQLAYERIGGAVWPDCGTLDPPDGETCIMSDIPW